MSFQTDVAIIGAGPVGLFAIFQCGMLGLKAHVIDALPSIGGQCSALYPEKPIYDIPGFASIDAQDLIDKLAEQGARFNPVFHLGQQVISVQKTPEGFDITTDKGTAVKARAIIIAGGAGAFGPNKPPLSNLESFEGTSVFYMVQKKEMFRNKKVVIAGGGDSAVDWALSLCEVASKVYLVHRRDKFKAAPESVRLLDDLTASGKIEKVVPHQLESLAGANGMLEGVGVVNLEGKKRILEADYLLPFYGLAMTLGPILDWGLSLDKNHIAVDQGTCATSVKGIYAIGDMATYDHKLKLILCGFSEAALASHAIYDLLNPDKPLHFEYSTSQDMFKK